MEAFIEPLTLNLGNFAVEPTAIPDLLLQVEGLFPGINVAVVHRLPSGDAHFYELHRANRAFVRQKRALPFGALQTTWKAGTTEYFVLYNGTELRVVQTGILVSEASVLGFVFHFYLQTAGYTVAFTLPLTFFGLGNVVLVDRCVLELCTIQLVV